MRQKLMELSIGALDAAGDELVAGYRANAEQARRNTAEWDSADAAREKDNTNA